MGIHVLGGDAFQFRIAANGAMRVERIAQGHQARVKTRFAAFATPGIDTKYAEDIVRDGLPARAARVLAFTDWAGHLGLRAFANGHRIGQSRSIGKAY